MRRDNLSFAFRVNIVVTLVGLALLGIGEVSGLTHRMPVDEPWGFYLFYLLASSTCQEFLYRGFLFAELRRAGVNGAAALIVITGALFAYLHVIYRDWTTVALALAFGLVLGWVYARTDNLWGVWVTHSVLGAASIAAGLV